MAKERRESWERYGRRFIIRLSLKQEEQRALLEEYDRRSALLGSEDKDFLVTCLIAGFRVLTERVGAMSGSVDGSFVSHLIDLSNNKSNNMIEKQKLSVSKFVSKRLAEPPTTDDLTPIASHTAPARARKILAGLMRHE